jgi:hypothetical protein
VEYLHTGVNFAEFFSRLNRTFSVCRTVSPLGGGTSFVAKWSCVAGERAEGVRGGGRGSGRGHITGTAKNSSYVAWFFDWAAFGAGRLVECESFPVGRRWPSVSRNAQMTTSPLVAHMAAAVGCTTTDHPPCVGSWHRPRAATTTMGTARVADQQSRRTLPHPSIVLDSIVEPPHALSSPTGRRKKHGSCQMPLPPVHLSARCAAPIRSSGGCSGFIRATEMPQQIERLTVHLRTLGRLNGPSDWYKSGTMCNLGGRQNV